MPGGDRTGPAGYGPLSGRGMGYCAGYHVPGYMNRPEYGRGLAFQRGFGRGFARGSGRGYRHHPYAPEYSYNPPYVEPKISKEENIEYMRDTARALEEELKYIKKQLSKLEEDNE